MRFDRHCLELSNSGLNSHVVSDCITLRNTAKAQAFKTRDIFLYGLTATFVISENFRSSFVGTCSTRAVLLASFVGMCSTRAILLASFVGTCSTRAILLAS